MRTIILKTVLALCAVFTFASGNLQDSTGTKPVIKKCEASSCMHAQIIFPIKPPTKPPKQQVFVMPVEFSQVKS